MRAEEERAGAGQAEAAEVTVGAVVRARNTGLASGSKREPRDPFRGHMKISPFSPWPFRIPQSGEWLSFGLERVSHETEQNENIPLPGAKTEETGARVKIPSSKLCFALKCEHAGSRARRYAQSSRWQQGAVEGLSK